MATSTRAEDVLEVLRRPARRQLLLRGFAPFAVAVLLLVAMVLLLPSVAPEQIIERPVDRSGPPTEATP